MFTIYKTKNPKIRLGPEGDSGYIFENLGGYDMYVGAGVGNMECCKSDYEVISHFNIPNYMFFDGTSVHGMPDDNPRFIKKNIHFKNTDTTTNLTEELKWYSNVLLKMDIEDGEWPWLLFADYDLLNKCKQIVIEMHFLMGAPDMYTKLVCFTKLLKTHTLVHGHGNNHVPHYLTVDGVDIPGVTEFTFIRNDCATTEISTETLPLPIDWPNEPSLPDNTQFKNPSAAA
jgi:hypothetical protein